MRIDLSDFTEDQKRQYRRAYRTAYYETHREELREKSRRYFQEHRDEQLRRNKERYKERSDIIKANAVRTGKILREKQRLAVLWHYSNRTLACVQCGFSDVRALVLDHINGGGTEQRRKLKNGGNVWFWLARHGFPSGYQILCANCNAIKAREENEYGSNSLIGTDWRSKFDWKKQMVELGLHERGRAWSLPSDMKKELEL